MAWFASTSRRDCGTGPVSVFILKDGMSTSAPNKPVISPTWKN
jgi:hypothetical protein